MKKVIIIPLLALGLIACQANTAEGPVKEDLELYNEVIDNYITFTEMSLDEAENTPPKEVKSGAYEYFHSGNIFEGISVTYFDINDNGVEELLIALRSDRGSYALIYLFTIVDGEVISLFTDEMSASVRYKRSGISLLENGNLIYMTASGAGEKYGTIYELKEEQMEYVEIYDVSLTEGDFVIIEKELESTLDIKALDWNAIEKERTVYDDFIEGDFSAVEGTWGWLRQ